MGKGMDKECVSLCKAINSIEGLRTTSSCCGHGKEPFLIFFKVEDTDSLPALLYFIDSCHTNIKTSWKCLVYTDCAMSPATFYIESPGKGKEAYADSEKIAKAIRKFLRDGNL